MVAFFCSATTAHDVRLLINRRQLRIIDTLRKRTVPSRNTCATTFCIPRLRNLFPFLATMASAYVRQRTDHAEGFVQALVARRIVDGCGQCDQMNRQTTSVVTCAAVTILVRRTHVL